MIKYILNILLILSIKNNFFMDQQNPFQKAYSEYSSYFNPFLLIDKAIKNPGKTSIGLFIGGVSSRIIRKKTEEDVSNTKQAFIALLASSIGFAGVYYFKKDSISKILESKKLEEKNEKEIIKLYIDIRSVSFDLQFIQEELELNEYFINKLDSFKLIKKTKEELENFNDKSNKELKGYIEKLKYNFLEAFEIKKEIYDENIILNKNNTNKKFINEEKNIKEKLDENEFKQFFNSIFKIKTFKEILEKEKDNNPLLNIYDGFSNVDKVNGFYNLIKDYEDFINEIKTKMDNLNKAKENKSQQNLNNNNNNNNDIQLNFNNFQNNIKQIEINNYNQHKKPINTQELQKKGKEQIKKNNKFADQMFSSNINTASNTSHKSKEQQNIEDETIKLEDLQNKLEILKKSGIKKNEE